MNTKPPTLQSVTLSSLKEGQKVELESGTYYFSHFDSKDTPHFIYRANGYQGYFNLSHLTSRSPLSALV